LPVTQSAKRTTAPRIPAAVGIGACPVADPAPVSIRGMASASTTEPGRRTSRPRRVMKRLPDRKPRI
jgi:hypothetical protein